MRKASFGKIPSSRMGDPTLAVGEIHHNDAVVEKEKDDERNEKGPL